MYGFKKIAKNLIQKCGYRITRDRPTNRFEAMRDTLIHLRNVGYSPRIVIDGGANVGQWTQMAMKEFPNAHFHLIEPLPNCQPILEKFVDSMERATLHQTAISRYGISFVEMNFLGDDGKSTGAQVAIDDEAKKWKSSSLPATDLDTLFSNLLTAEDRAFLKLDLQHHEIPALEGATKVLSVIEVILAEMQLFAINDNKRPVFEDLLLFLNQRDFALYDVVSLQARERDNRAMCGDVVFVRRGSPLLSDDSWT